MFFKKNNEKNLVVQLDDCFLHQGEQLILKEVYLKIAMGEFVYLVGKTGSGKSTLLKALYGELPLSSGKGIVAEYDLRKMNWKNIPLLRRRLGIVFQDFNLLEDRNVENNLRFVLEATGWKDNKRILNRIDDVLNMVGLKTKGYKMPYEISGGEQQRVVIARALLNNPRLILADEPSGNLDPETADDIILLLRKLNKEYKTAVLLATHDYRILENYPSRIIRCQGGRILDEENFVV